MDEIKISTDVFLKSLSGPLMISWDITNKCNMNCRHCLNRSNDAYTHSFEDEFNCDEFDNKPCI